MHEQADLLDGEGDVQASKGEPLESTSKTTILSGVSYRGTIGGELGAGVNWGGTRLAVLHPSMLQDVKYILTL